MDGLSKPTIEHWKKLWAIWDVRVVILVSLFLQILLIFSAPLRKRMSRAFVTMPLWLAYLLADITANFAVGLISKSQWSTSGSETSPDLLAFWAPFLLVHLGGPDTITAFALEDNELWLRHFLGLGFQCWAVIYAFVQSYPFKELWRPTMLMFFAGLIKYTERTRSLYLASTRRFRDSLLTSPDPGPNYAKLMDEYTSKIKAKLPTRIEMLPEPNRVIKTESAGDRDDLSDLEVVRRAYGFFVTFKGLIADLIFSFRERSLSRDFFLKRTARDAFRVVEVELNFIYEILYTKVVVVQSFWGYFFRFASFTLTCAALLLFCFMSKKEFQNFDIGVTYTLLIGAIALDAISFAMVLSSDWTAVTLTEPDYPTCFFRFLISILRVKRNRWPENQWKFMQMLRRRWSETISQYNLIQYCLNPRMKWWEKFIGWFGLTNKLDGLKYVETVSFTNELRDHIFEELKMKSEMADDLETAKEIYSARGDWVLRFESCNDLLPWINEVDFDESILLWHIATELCLNAEDSGNAANAEGVNVKKSENAAENNAENSGNAANAEGVNAKNSENAAQNNAKNSGNAANAKGVNAKKSESAAKKKDYRELSKLLSNYMLYLLIMQATMMSTVAGIGQIRFRDTCAEAKKFFRGRKIKKDKKNFCLYKCFCGSESEHKQKNQTSPKAPTTQEQRGEETTCSCLNIFCCFKICCCKGDSVPDKVQKHACNSILGVNTAVKPVAVKGDRSKSVLFDASMLAKELNKLGEEKKWEIMSKVWVELLSYAACRCRAITHASQLSKGGQLITLVWLLMAHFGLGSQFQISEGHARAKLIVGK
ncbi:hypothetical protein LOK49_LG09G00519 [Camellia lanceoleosa]|uniref:Uncharacterized protein n=1 Tax=Camellia lanceoleosa TaxID=1840588 RepID=A0ACC0GLN6_9ERIC|nr:hypothetical protein LOK49_LG09G00519 [Camellia lanceoleosa]